MEEATSTLQENIPLNKTSFIQRVRSQAWLCRLVSQCVSIAFFLTLWYFAALSYNSQILMPTPQSTLQAFVKLFYSMDIWENLLLTLERVFKGLSCAVLLGVPLGLLMGRFKLAMDMLDPLLGCLRQIPIMAWIPLSIIWFGLGNGPTIFMIAMSGLFCIVLNTISGVQNISQDYFHAARSMGANSWSIFRNIILPASLPNILIGARLALSGGWMAVICAEFIATSAGFGFSMVAAQTRMETEKLLALMALGSFVGYFMDKFICVISAYLCRWK